ncbi:hypothetical protein BDR22DRAFT_884786 [Usnea florida]
MSEEGVLKGRIEGKRIPKAPRNEKTINIYKSDAAEPGFSWENFVFGGGVDTTGNQDPLTVTKWPNFLRGDRDLRRDVWKTSTTIWIIPKQWVVNVNSQRWWDRVIAEDDDPLQIKRLIGYRRYHGSPHEPDNWSASQSEEGIFPTDFQRTQGKSDSPRVSKLETVIVVEDPSASRANECLYDAATKAVADTSGPAGCSTRLRGPRGNLVALDDGESTPPMKKAKVGTSSCYHFARYATLKGSDFAARGVQARKLEAPADYFRLCFLGLSKQKSSPQSGIRKRSRKSRGVESAKSKTRKPHKKQANREKCLDIDLAEDDRRGVRQHPQKIKSIGGAAARNHMNKEVRDREAQREKERPKEHQDGTPMYEVWTKPGTHRRMLHDFKILPDKISTEESWLFIEFVRRMDPRVAFNDILMRQKWWVERQNTTDWNYINKHFNAPAKTISQSSQPLPQSLWSFMSEESLPDIMYTGSFLC